MNKNTFYEKIFGHLLTGVMVFIVLGLTAIVIKAIIMVLFFT